MSEFEFYELDGEFAVVTTSTGARIRCLPVGDLLLQVGAHLLDPDKPEPPMYTMVDAAGDEMEFPHDEESVVDPKTSDEERAAWIEYKAALTTWEQGCAANQAKRRLWRGRFIAEKGIELLDLPSEDDLAAWAQEQEGRYGLPVPESERFVQWVNREVIRSQADGNKVTLGIMKASGMDQEVLDQIEDSFRREMGWPERADAEGDQAGA